MGIELRIDGTGKIFGGPSNISGYSVSEEAVPLDVGNSRGAVGEITIGASEDVAADGSGLLINDVITLSDGFKGTSIGTVNDVSIADGKLNITADSRLALLVTDAKAEPVHSTLETVFRYYLSLANITSNIVVNADIASIPVVAVGWVGDIWVHIKELCAAYKVEVALVSNNIVLRSLRERTALTGKDKSERLQLSNADLAQNVEVFFYNSEYSTARIAYPVRGWNAAADVWQVDAGQTISYTVPIEASLESVNVPQAMLTVDQDYSGPLSVYSVINGRAEAVDPAVWTANGGSVTAIVDPEDPNALVITLTGMNDSENAPYRIATAIDEDDNYNSLRITGAGVFITPQSYTISTGAPVTKTATDKGRAINSIFVNTQAQAYDNAVIAGGRSAGPNQVLTITTTLINRKGDTGEVVYPAFSAFNTEWAGKTFAQFDTAWAGKTFADFTARYYDEVSTAFENQAFGNVAGARRRYRQAYYRIISADNTANEITYTAERDTLFQDFNAENAGKTFAQFNARFAGKRFEDFAVIPLWT